MLGGNFLCQLLETLQQDAWRLVRQLQSGLQSLDVLDHHHSLSKQCTAGAQGLFTQTEWCATLLIAGYGHSIQQNIESLLVGSYGHTTDKTLNHFWLLIESYGHITQTKQCTTGAQGLITQTEWCATLLIAGYGHSTQQNIESLLVGSYGHTTQTKHWIPFKPLPHFLLLPIPPKSMLPPSNQDIEPELGSVSYTADIYSCCLVLWVSIIEYKIPCPTYQCVHKTAPLYSMCA